MSSDSNFAEEAKCCASCGIAENDDIKLKKCTACYLVKYCSIKCQKNHWSQHKRACRLRAAELRDEILFKQPESSHLGDCPLCMIPLKIDGSGGSTMACCSKFVCHGCSYANQTQEREMRLEHKCPFCRHPAPTSQTEAAILFKEKDRVEMNDPIALRKVGVLRYQEGDHNGAFEFWTKAAELGDLQAQFQLSILYHNGEGVKKNEKKEVYHLEQAAIGGHPIARCNLGCIEVQHGRHDRAVKHWIIAASQGDFDSLRHLNILYQNGEVSKEDLAAAIRAHQAAVDATKSPHRDAAAAFLSECVSLSSITSALLVSSVSVATVQLCCLSQLIKTRTKVLIFCGLSFSQGREYIISSDPYYPSFSVLILTVNTSVVYNDGPVSCGDGSLANLRKMYQDGLVSKEDLATALRAHKAAVSKGSGRSSFFRQ